MNDREIAEYLLANPDFFVEHASLLATIRLGNPHGKAAVSLQERQMDMLRAKNKQLELQLSELLRHGHENDRISARFARWTTRVMAERDPYALPRTIAHGLRDVFDVPQAALRVWDVASTYAQADFARHTAEEIRLFASRLATPYCGANTGFEAVQWLASSAACARGAGAAVSDGAIAGAVGTLGAPVAPASATPDNAALLGALASNGTPGGIGNAYGAHGAKAPAAEGEAAPGSASDPVASIALVALRDPEADASASAFGLLVMGSPDPRRFHEGMATDFLSRIGTLASAALTRLLPH